jgi:hypothetical protein
MLTIVPTRGRNQNAIRLFDAINATADFTELVFAVDSDDLKTYSGLMSEVSGVNNAKVVVASPMGMNATLNHWATWFAPDYDYIAFMGDDHLPKTVGWDSRLAQAIGNKPGVAYGNDLLQGANLPTAVVLSAGIVEATGFMAPPPLKHLFMDNYWLALGEALGNIHYLDSVIIEHLHYTNGKAEADERYLAVNNDAIHNADADYFGYYIKTHFQSDLELINAHFNNRP